MSKSEKKWWESKTLAALIGIVIIAACDKLGVGLEATAFITAIVAQKVGIQGWIDAKRTKSR